MFQVLEDNQVTLSTMKASRFVKAFEQEVYSNSMHDCVLCKGGL